MLTIPQERDSNGRQEGRVAKKIKGPCGRMDHFHVIDAVGPIFAELPLSTCR